MNSHLKSRVGTLMALSMIALAGCGPDCQTACRKIYAPEECNIATPGVPDWTDMFDECQSECEDALRQPGEIGNYDPDERPEGGQSVTLENERQAAAWMDCVTETSCERINDGYCPGGTN